MLWDHNGIELKLSNGKVVEISSVLLYQQCHESLKGPHHLEKGLYDGPIRLNSSSEYGVF